MVFPHKQGNAIVTYYTTMYGEVVWICNYIQYNEPEFQQLPISNHRGIRTPDLMIGKPV